MEIGEINKVATRKKISVEVDKLRDKVSKEASKIIKLKVAQDTAYWDLKEKLQQVEGNHERLQQNMAEVQMQHETVSGQYQDELRLRPDTLNKLSSTRDICEVLEAYSERLKETLSRCRADQAALSEAYQRSGHLVRDIRNQQLRADERNRQVITGLEDKVKLTSEHQSQLFQLFTSSKQQSETEIAELKGKLDGAQKHKDDLLANVSKLNRQIDSLGYNVEKKDETISNLQRDMKEMINEFKKQAAEAKSTLHKQDEDLNQALEANSSLKEAIFHQEQFTQSLCVEKKNLQEKLAVLEEGQATSANIINDLKAQIQDITNMNEQLKKEIANLVDEKERLNNILNDKEQILVQYQSEIDKLNQQIAEAKFEKQLLESDLRKSVDISEERSRCIEELKINIQNYVQKIEEMQNAHDLFRQKSEKKIQEQTTLIEARDKELDSKASTITQLMSELKTSTDVRSKLETNLQKARREMEMEKDSGREREKKMAARIEQLETAVRDKEEELLKQMSTILENRNEKNRLQEKIQGMQNTIDNIQKELIGKPKAMLPVMQPELDDNAVMFSPGHKRPGHENQKRSEGATSPILQTQTALPREEPTLDSMIYNIFSDSSADGDMIDVSEVNRRFAALSRGERVPRVPLSALKRHRPQDCHASISLSQAKEDLKKKEKTFFKNKRVDNKTKKAK